MISYPFVLAIIIALLLLSLGLYSFLKSLSTQFKTLASLKCWRKALLISIAFALLMFLSRLHQPAVRLLYDYLGLISFAFFFSLGYWLLFFPLKYVGRHHWVANRYFGSLFCLLLLAVISLAIYNFHKPLTVVNYEFESAKISRVYRFVQISDIQYGTISKQRMNSILEQAYSLKPEFIVFTGDLVDFNGYQREDFQRLAESPVPIFFERGNHEFYHDPTRLLEDLKSISRVRLLLNEAAIFDELQLVGIDFSREPGHLLRQLSSIDLDRNRYLILLYHEPRDVEVGSRHHFDLMLFGHTHGGQIWPWTLVIDWIYPYGDGYFKQLNSHIYTSDGASLWGPKMRLGSQNEILLFTLKPIAGAG